jgi:hypothetical protein
MIPIAAYFVVNNQTFEIDEHIKGPGFTFDLESIHIIEAKGFTVKQFSNIPGTDKIHVKIGGVDVTATIDAKLEALSFIPFEASALNITNATLEFTVKSMSDDGVHWAIDQNTTMTIGKVDIKMKSGFLNWLVKQSSSIINKIIDLQLPRLSSFIDAKVSDINEMIAQESDYTFSVPIFGKNYPLNLTMTAAPKIGGELIQFYMDGQFDVAENATDASFPREIN